MKHAKRIAVCCATLMVLMGSTAMAEPHTETRNKQAISTAFEAWKNAATGNVFDLLVPDATWTIVGNSPISRTYTSRQEFLDVVIKPFNMRLSKRLVPTVRGIYADGDMVIALFDAEGRIPTRGICRCARDGSSVSSRFSIPSSSPSCGQGSILNRS